MAKKNIFKNKELPSFVKSSLDSNVLLLKMIVGVWKIEVGEMITTKKSVTSLLIGAWFVLIQHSCWFRLIGKNGGRDSHEKARIIMGRRMLHGNNPKHMKNTIANYVLKFLGNLISCIYPFIHSIQLVLSKHKKLSFLLYSKRSIEIDCEISIYINN